MSNIIQFPMPQFTPDQTMLQDLKPSTIPISPEAMMDFAAAWDIDTEEELISLNDWMVKLVQMLDDLE